MLNKSANYLVNLLEKYYYLSDEEKPIYIYGFELLLSTSLSITTIFFIAVLIDKPSYALSFFLFFFSLRLFTGGYHAKTYLKCFLTTNAIFLLNILLTELVLILRINWTMPIFVVFATITIWLFAPIKNKNHPCSDETYIKNKTKARFISSLCVLVYIYIYYFTNFDDIAINSAWHLLIVSVMILIEKITSSGGENQ